MKRRLILALSTLLSLVQGTALAQPAAAPQPVIAVVSTVSDQFTITTYRPSVGSSLDRNLKEVVPLDDKVFDQVALVAANEVLGGRHDKDHIVFLAAAPGGNYADVNRTIDGNRFNAPDWLAEAMKRYKVDRLLLVSKLNAEADFALHRQAIGSGRIEGLGFFVDRVTGLINVETGANAHGFVAPYAYLRVSLIDVASMNVVAHKSVTRSQVHTKYNNDASFDPWQAITPAEKLAELRRLVHLGVRDAVRELVP